jgi:histidinol dehydrogenase
MADARDRLDRGLLAALELAASNVRAVATAQIRDDDVVVEPGQGQRIDVRQVPVASAAIYAPGGRAVYPSSVVMGVVPAKVAGVERVVVTSPPAADGTVPDAVLAAALISGADEVYAIGGAQAIAALAYGTESVHSVDFIAGPGGPVVQEAKLAVSRGVGIDGYAGPSELMVLFDGSANVGVLALDLCAQAEHGADGLLVAAATDDALLERLADAVRAEAKRHDVFDAPLAMVTVPDLATGVQLADLIAPEHLQIACEEDEALARGVRYAGCVFTGEGGATAFGDYVAGSNHILPTGGAGRFRGPLGPAGFRRPISLVHLDGRAAAQLADPLEAISSFEGFPVHAASARARAAQPSGSDDG